MLLMLNLWPANSDVIGVGVAKVSELPGWQGRGVWTDLLTEAGQSMHYLKCTHTLYVWARP